MSYQSIQARYFGKEILTFTETAFQTRLELLGQNMEVWKYKSDRGESKHSL